MPVAVKTLNSTGTISFGFNGTWGKAIVDVHGTDDISPGTAYAINTYGRKAASRVAVSNFGAFPPVTVYVYGGNYLPHRNEGPTYGVDNTANAGVRLFNGAGVRTMGSYRGTNNKGRSAVSGSGAATQVTCGVYNTGGYGYSYTIQGFSDGTSSSGSSGGLISGSSCNKTSIKVNLTSRNHNVGTGSIKEISWESNNPYTVARGSVRLRVGGLHSQATAFRHLYTNAINWTGNYSSTLLSPQYSSHYSGGGYTLWHWSGYYSSSGSQSANILFGNSSTAGVTEVHTLFQEVVAMALQWNIIYLKRTQINGVDDVVTHIHWSAQDCDTEGNYALVEGTVCLDVSNVSSESSLIAYSELTRERVLAWIKAGYTGDGTKALLSETDIEDNWTWTVMQDLTASISAEPQKEIQYGTPW